MSSVKESMPWYGTLLIIIVVIAAVGGIGYGIYYYMKHRTTIANQFQYRHIDEKTALAQNQAEMEAW